MLREVFYKRSGANGTNNDVLCPRLLSPDGTYELVLDETAQRLEEGFKYSLGLM